MTTPIPFVARGLTKRIGNRLIVGPLDLDIAAGTTLVLRGPNGAGKSTLLRMLAGIARPSAGQLLVHGVDAAGDPDAARRHLAWVGPEAPCYAELTPREHLSWWAQLHGHRLDPTPLLAEAGLMAVAGRPAGRLSRGERQRLALALAFATQAPTLLLDEPFAGLDEAGSEWLRTRLAAHVAGDGNAFTRDLNPSRRQPVEGLQQRVGTVVVALHGDELPATRTLDLAAPPAIHTPQPGVHA